MVASALITQDNMAMVSVIRNFFHFNVNYNDDTTGSIFKDLWQQNALIFTGNDRVNRNKTFI